MCLSAFVLSFRLTLFTTRRLVTARDNPSWLQCCCCTWVPHISSVQQKKILCFSNNFKSWEEPFCFSFHVGIFLTFCNAGGLSSAYPEYSELGLLYVQCRICTVTALNSLRKISDARWGLLDSDIIFFINNVHYFHPPPPEWLAFKRPFLVTYQHCHLVDKHCQCIPRSWCTGGDVCIIL